MEKMWETNYNVVATQMMLCIAFATILLAVEASDPSPLQDFCIGVQDLDSAVFVNGMVCKDPTTVTAQDFIYKGFNKIGDTNNVLRASATLVNSFKFPALNTQGLSIAHVDFGPFGLNTPHHHPRASEVFTVITGTIYAGFVTTDYRLFSTILNPGDVIVFPQGLIHFQYNLKRSNARAIVAFGSQHAGRVNSAQALFGSTPSILEDVLAKAYQVDDEVIEQLRSQFSNAAANQIVIETSVV